MPWFGKFWHIVCPLVVFYEHLFIFCGHLDILLSLGKNWGYFPRFGTYVVRPWPEGSFYARAM
jgi:hypothetical protein